MSKIMSSKMSTKRRSSDSKTPLRQSYRTQQIVAPLPATFPKLTSVKLPQVRILGVKQSIEILSNSLKCPDYQVSPIQFWFLDTVVDMLWRLQDEYQLPQEHQKIVIEWVLYFFNLIRELAPSRRRSLEIFKEAIDLGESYSDTGVSNLPLPGEIFTMNKQLIATREDSGSEDSSIFDLDDDFEEVLVVKNAEETQVFKLPSKPCPWYPEDEECTSSSLESLSDSGRKTVEVRDVKHDSQSILEDEDFNFYKADMATPPRFKSEDTSLPSFDMSIYTYLSQSASKEMLSDDSEPDLFKWISISKNLPPGPCPSLVVGAVPSEIVENEIKKSWHEYNLWHIKKDFYKDEGKLKSDQTSFKSEQEKKLEQNVFVNTCVLMAIKEFVYEYFYESFQFDLILEAVRHNQRLLMQNINEEWHVPKKFKGDFKRPPVKIPKKLKEEKKKKDKSEFDKEKESKGKKKRSEEGEKKSKKDKGAQKDEKGSDKEAKRSKKGEKKSKKDKEPQNDEKGSKKGEKKSKKDEKESTKGEKASKKGEKGSKKDEASKKDEKESTKGEKGSKKGEKASKKGEKASKKGEKGSKKDEASKKDEKESTKGEKGSKKGEKGSKKSEKNREEPSDEPQEKSEKKSKKSERKSKKGGKKSKKPEEEEEEAKMVEEQVEKKKKDKKDAEDLMTEKEMEVKKEQEKYERIRFENKKFLFPLTDAVDDKFFYDVFDDWVKPARKKKTEKPEKSSKSDKDSDETKDKKEKDKKVKKEKDKGDKKKEDGKKSEKNEKKKKGKKKK